MIISSKKSKYAFSVAEAMILLLVTSMIMVCTAPLISKNIDTKPVRESTIVMWAKEIETIPDGWVLCDGTNGTPDLRDRFVVGAGGTYAAGKTGGANSVKLTVEELPRHTHITSIIISETHGTAGMPYGAAEPPYYEKDDPEGLVPENLRRNFEYTYKMGHGGGDRPHENRPPYYALVYIMKKN